MAGGASVIERETVIGAIVLVAAACVLALAYAGNVERKPPGYELDARFAKAEGVDLGSDVRLAGVKIGKVVGQRLDERFRALITMRIAPAVQLPTDSAALIETDGLLGAKFIAIQPGADEADLKPGAEFQFTQGSMNVSDILELIISQAKVSRGEAPPPAAAK